MKKLFRIGSRASRLALVQAQAIKAMLSEAHPEAEFEIVKISTIGDQNRRVSLGRLPGVGFFVKELEVALLEDRVDIAVHSLKDMPAEVPLGLCLAAVPERVDARDVLISQGKALKELPKGAKIGSDSLRRAFQIKAVRPDIEVSTIRGNIETRLKAVETGRFDGVMLAAAGLIRLGWADRITQLLPLDDFLPPPGQAALGIEIRKDDADTARIVATLDDPATHQSVLAERAFLRRLGGGCRAPIAALGTVENGILTLRGMVADEKGENIFKEAVAGKAAEAEDLGNALAETLLKMGAAKFLTS
jgi:hydroxymethylbilane synthase